jgi:hypothetical protein
MKAFSIVAASLLIILGVATVYLGWQRDRERSRLTHPSEIFKARQEAFIKSQQEVVDEARKLPGGGAWPGVPGGTPVAITPLPKAATPPAIPSTPAP